MLNYKFCRDRVCPVCIYNTVNSMIAVFLILFCAVSREYSNPFPNGVSKAIGLKRSQDVEVISIFFG
jgi:hypothetical protein